MQSLSLVSMCPVGGWSFWASLMAGHPVLLSQVTDSWTPGPDDAVSGKVTFFSLT